MTLKEAIEQAGEGGKIRRTLWGDSLYVVVRKEDLWDDEYRSVYHTASIANLTADDWEVVQPDIEVGDVVKVKGVGYEHTVTWVRDDRAQIQFMDDAHSSPLPIKSLTLIHKGPKKTTHDIIIGAPIPNPELSHMVWPVYGSRTLKEGHYRMTLEKIDK